MKIKIENFGPVKEFIFDTDKTFHLIVGDNNVGKSYVLTAYYFLVKTLIEISSPKHISRNWYFINQINDEDAELTETAETAEFKKIVTEIKSGDLDISEFYILTAKEFLQSTLALELSKRIKSSYNELGSIVNSFSKEKFSKFTIEMPMATIVLEGNVDEFRVVKILYKRKTTLRASKQNRHPTIIGGKQIIYKHTSEDADTTIARIKHHSIGRFMTYLEEAIGSFIDIDYLPASRSGLYQALSAFGQIIAELSKNRSFLSSKIELPGISGQLSDYFIKLTSISSTSPGEGEAFQKVAKSIEESVLKGSIEYDFLEKKLYYRPEGTDLRLDLSATSSMVSETAPIVAYIRHIIAWDNQTTSLTKLRRRYRGTKPLNKILIIEEPEAHLHPSKQIRMTNIYADLAKNGVNIIMTSHSNYVFNKVSNLVIEGKLDVETTQCDLFRMTELGSIGESQRIDEYGIDDENFSDSSEELMNERLDLINNKEI